VFAKIMCTTGIIGSAMDHMPTDISGSAMDQMPADTIDSATVTNSSG